jgi:hypothetical protein
LTFLPQILISRYIRMRQCKDRSRAGFLISFSLRIGDSQRMGSDPEFVINASLQTL